MWMHNVGWKEAWQNLVQFLKYPVVHSMEYSSHTLALRLFNSIENFILLDGID